MTHLLLQDRRGLSYLNDAAADLSGLAGFEETGGGLLADAEGGSTPATQHMQSTCERVKNTMTWMWMDKKVESKILALQITSQRALARQTHTHIYRCVCVYMCIYIYIWLWGRLPPQKMPFFSFFPSFIVKNGQKEMLQICPVSLHPFLSP